MWLKVINAPRPLAPDIASHGVHRIKKALKSFQKDLCKGM